MKNVLAKLFKSAKPKNHIIKLFKVVDQVSAEEFDMKGCILSVIDSITQYTNLKATEFDLNYRDSRKTLDGFRKALQNQEEIVHCLIGFDSNKTKTYFSVSNPMLNWTIRPDKSTIDICIQIALDRIEQKNENQIAEELIPMFQFDYGYKTKIPSNYIAVTERKIKKGLFSTKVEINHIDKAWTSHSTGILEGHIREIYPTNFLNKSHFENSAIKHLIYSNGSTKEITEHILKWTLTSEEIKTLKTKKSIQEISI